MNEAIASIHHRIAQGGDWRGFRDEIASLHDQAVNQVEFVTLLEAFANLVDVGPSAFDHDTWMRVRPVALGEYKLFLNIEAMEGGKNINPIMLDYITRREVESGRLATDDDFRAMAAAGTVLGDGAVLEQPLRRPGNWLACGLVLGGLALWLFGVREPISPLWLLPAAVLLGWFPNDRERREVKKAVIEKRVSRGYPPLAA